MIFYKESSFQETPIGKIPSDWTIIKLEKVLHLRNGERPKISDGGDVPVFGANGIMGYTNEVLVDNEFTIVVGRVGASGQVHLGKGKIWVSDNAIYSENYDNKRAHPPFLFYLLRHRKLDQFASKTTHPIITQTFLNNFLIHLPPLEEQKRIAKILGVVDSVIAKTGEVIAKTERLKKGLMQTLLTRGIGHKEFKDTEIGRIPKDWEVVKIVDACAKVKAGGTPLTSKKEYYNGDIPFVKIEDLANAQKYLKNTLITITKAGLENSSAWLVPPKSILLAMYGSIGAMAINEIPVATNQAILGIVPKEEKTDVEFIYYLLNFLTPHFARHAKQTTQANLTAEIVREFKIPIPPILEQRKIAEILSTVDKKLEFEKNEKAKLERIKLGLMDLLLTGKIRIKVN